MVAEKVLLLSAVALYVVSAVLFAARLLTSRPAVTAVARGLAALGLAVHSVALAVRWSQTGHGPYVNTYEVLSSDAWLVVLLFSILQLRFKWIATLGAIVMPLAFLLLGAAFTGSDEVRRLTPIFRSSWLVVHILFAKLTVASIALASALALAFLVKEGRDDGPGWLARLPVSAVLDDYSYRFVAFGFIALTCMIIAGAIWANASWGSYWSWDPTETWSLVVWLVYGLYLHGRVTFRWKGKISAYFVVGAFAFSLVAFFVFPYLVKGQHTQYMTR